MMGKNTLMAVTVVMATILSACDIIYNKGNSAGGIFFAGTILTSVCGYFGGDKNGY